MIAVSKISDYFLQNALPPINFALKCCAAEIVKDANQVAIEVGCEEFAQLPRLILGLRNDPGLRCAPLREKFVNLSPAAEVDPDNDATCVPVGIAKGAVSDKQPAIPPRDARDTPLVIAPIESEAQRIDVAGHCLVDVRRRNLRDSSRENHGLSIL
jgi:hypothetical protein